MKRYPIVISWWEKIILKFLPTYVSIDVGNFDVNMAVYFKKFRGKIYVVKEERI